jgi:protein kinase
MDQYHIIELIGDGTYGTVYKGKDIETNEYVAIKKMKKQYDDFEQCKTLKEIEALTQLKHSNIVTLNTVILEKKELFLIFEFIGVNLFEWRRNFNEISENKIRNISFQILQGLAFMHKNNFFHRDMKPENILISGDQVKLADFGLAKEIRSQPPFTDYVATRWYRSPEVILDSKKYGSPIDIFALGAIIAELYTGKPLFPGNQASEQMGKICEVLGTPSETDWEEGYVLANKLGYKFPQYKGHKLKTFIPNASENALNLLESMLSFNPIKRPSAVKCLQHPFFQCFDILSFFGLKVNVGGNHSNTNNNNNNNTGDKKDGRDSNMNTNALYSMSSFSNNVANMDKKGFGTTSKISGTNSNKDNNNTKQNKNNKMQFEELFN